MSNQTSTTSPAVNPPRHRIAKAWRRWWMRAAHHRQMRHLRDVTLDPHMARDLGLPVQERPKLRLDLW